MIRVAGLVNRQLPPWEQAPFFQAPYEHKEHVLTGSWTRICDHNDARIALLFQVAQATDAYVSTQQPVAIQGIHLIGTVGPVELWHSLHAGLVTCEWFGQGNGAPTDITVIEVIMVKWPGDQ